MRYRLHNGELVPSHLIPREPSNRSHLSAPMLVRDQIDAFRSQANGMLYESKSQYRQSLKDAGCVELGNDAPDTMRSTPGDLNEPPPAEADVKQAMEQLGYAS